MGAAEPSADRLIKPHRKSRAGCGNCKLRKVKCDESKPTCKRCSASGVSCYYSHKNAAPKTLLNDLTKAAAFDVVSFSLNSIKSPGINQYVFKEHDWDILSRFRNRTALTITTDRTRGIYQNPVVEIAPVNSFLMHSILALTLMHDRHLPGNQHHSQPAMEAYHQYQSIALFNMRLALPLQPSPSESAALWVTAIFLGLMTFCHVEATSPEESWPLKRPSSSDLSWLVMSEGKTKLWKMTQSFTTEARFRGLVPPSIKGMIPKSSTGAELNVLPSELIKICALDTVTDKSNPYHAVAATLAKSLTTDFVSALLSFLVLISNIPEDYKQLLKQKDPRALLLLAYWYARLCEVEIWWFRPRATLEGHAICLYLRRYHREDSELQNLMRTVWEDLRGQLSDHYMHDEKGGAISDATFIG